VGLRNECTSDFAEIGPELGRKRKRKTGRPISDSSSSLTREVSEERNLEHDTMCLSEGSMIRLKICETVWRHFTHEGF